MTKLTTEIRQILMGLTDAEDIRQAVACIKFAQGQSASRAKWSFHPGQKVQFFSKAGVKQVGTVTKIMQKNIGVSVGGMRWRVHPSFLSPVTE